MCSTGSNSAYGCRTPSTRNTIVETPGNTGAIDPLQKGAIGGNKGKMPVVTTIEMVVGNAHCPAAGVKVYVPEVVLLTIAGFHVPVIPLFEVVANTGAIDPLHIGTMLSNKGTVRQFLYLTASSLYAADQ